MVNLGVMGRVIEQSGLPDVGPWQAEIQATHGLQVSPVSGGSGSHLRRKWFSLYAPRSYQVLATLLPQTPFSIP